AILDGARLLAAPADRKRIARELTAQRYREAFAWYGLPVEDLEPAEAAERVRSSALREPLVAALDDWAFQNKADLQKQAHLCGTADRADSNDWRRRLRAAWWAGDVEGIRRAAGETPPDRLSPSAAALLGSALAYLQESDKALEVLTQAQRAHPDD